MPPTGATVSVQAQPPVTGTRPAAAVFDVDGTLIDGDRRAQRTAFNQAFAAFDLPDRWDRRTYGRLLAVNGGRPRLEHYLRAEGWDPDRAERWAARLHAEKNRRYARLVTAGEVTVRPGARRLLTELADLGVPLGVATAGSGERVRSLLDRLFGPDRFAAVVTADDVPTRKPDPAAYHRILERLAVDPARTVAVEDSGDGLRAAVAAGLVCLVVTNVYTRGDDLTGAALVVDSFGDGSPATVAAGPSDVLDRGRVIARTLTRLLPDEAPHDG